MPRVPTGCELTNSRVMKGALSLLHERRATSRRGHVFGGNMELGLSNDDMETLRELLRECLPQLKFEAARTDVPELRRSLLRRERLCERLLGQLEGESVHS